MKKARLSLIVGIVSSIFLIFGCGQNTPPVSNSEVAASLNKEEEQITSDTNTSVEQKSDDTTDSSSSAAEPVEESSNLISITPSLLVDNSLYSVEAIGFSADSSGQEGMLTLAITNKSDSPLNLSGTAKYHDSTAESGVGCGVFYFEEFAPGSREEVTMNINDYEYSGSMGQIDCEITASMKDENEKDYYACQRADAFSIRTTNYNEQDSNLLLDNVVVEKQSLLDDDYLMIEANTGYYNSCIGYVVDVSFTNKTGEETEIYIDSPMINNESLTGFKFGFFAPDGKTDVSKVSGSTLVLDPEETTTVPMCVTSFSLTRLSEKMEIHSAEDIESFSFDIHHHKNETAHVEISTGKP